jgi:cyclic pyranopterin phosphate synthase
MKNKLTHLDENGRARMVDVAAKAVTSRRAVAEATICMRPETLALITKKNAPKGDVLAVARVAGIQAAKRTHELIPLCHPLALTSVAVNFEALNKSTLRIEAAAQCEAKTGVEMEALMAASIAGLTVYDMLKAVDRGMEMNGVRLLEKSGGRSGHYSIKKEKLKRKK